jgi:hypothetical protein
MAPGSAEGRFRQCRCLLRVVTVEAQTAKDTQLTVDPIYVSVKPRREVRHAALTLAHLRIARPMQPSYSVFVSVKQYSWT